MLVGFVAHHLLHLSKHWLVAVVTSLLCIDPSCIMSTTMTIYFVMVAWVKLSTYRLHSCLVAVPSKMLHIQQHCVSHRQQFPSMLRQIQGSSDAAVHQGKLLTPEFVASMLEAAAHVLCHTFSTVIITSNSICIS